MFDDRWQAGEALAAALATVAPSDPVVYALPRGGLPVAAPVARRLGAPLDVILVRKLGAPGHAELAIGAVVDGAAPTIVLHQDVIRALGVSDRYIERVRTAALAEIERRGAIFHAGRKPVSPAGRNVIIVDDGLATGATMETAVEAMRRAGAAHITVASPVAPIEVAEKFSALADDVVCLETPSPFRAVGDHYRHFPQLADDEAVDILSRFRKPAERRRP